ERGQEAHEDGGARRGAAGGLHRGALGRRRRQGGEAVSRAAGDGEDAAPARRATHVDHEVVYASVGASAATDLLRFPPQGSNPFEHGLQLGSGAERFTTASSTLMTWGAQRAVGIDVSDIEHPDEERYSGVVFDHDGVPSAAPDAEVRYGPDGEEFLTAG